MKKIVFSLFLCFLLPQLFGQEIDFGKSIPSGEESVYSWEATHSKSAIAPFYNRPPFSASNKDFQLYYYRYYFRSNTAVDCEVLEANGQIFPLKGGWIRGTEEWKDFMTPPLMLMTVPGIYAYTYKNKKYFVGNVSPAGAHGFAQTYFLFDITNPSKIRCIAFSGYTYLGWSSADDMLVLYPDKNGKLCIVNANRDNSTLQLRAQLYSIEEYGLAEVLDSRGEPIGVVFSWERNNWNEKGAYEPLVIKSVNIPKDIPLSELQFRPVEKYRFQEAATEEEIQTMLAKWKTGKPISLEEYDAEKKTPAESAPQHIPYKPDYTPPIRFYEYAIPKNPAPQHIPFPALAVFTLALTMGFSAVIIRKK